MQFDFSRLRGRMVEKFGSITATAAVIHLSVGALCSRLNNGAPFRPEEIYLLSAPDCLDIPDAEIVAYFFTPKVR